MSGACFSLEKGVVTEGEHVWIGGCIPHRGGNAIMEITPLAQSHFGRVPRPTQCGQRPHIPWPGKNSGRPSPTAGPSYPRGPTVGSCPLGRSDGRGSGQRSAQERSAAGSAARQPLRIRGLVASSAIGGSRSSPPEGRYPKPPRHPHRGDDRHCLRRMSLGQRSSPNPPWGVCTAWAN